MRASAGVPQWFCFEFHPCSSVSFIAFCLFSLDHFCDCITSLRVEEWQRETGAWCDETIISKETNMERL